MASGCNLNTETSYGRISATRISAKVRMVLHRQLQNEPRFGLHHMIQLEGLLWAYVGSICLCGYTIKRAASRQPADLADACQASG
jgi:hypothetical protein